MWKSGVNQSIVLVAMGAVLAGPALGQQLTLVNPGFDAQTIALGGWIEGAAAVTGWTISNSAGAQHMPSSAINPPAQDGLNHGYLNQNGSMYQVPQYQGSPVFVQANQTYKVSLWVGRRAGNEGTYGGILRAFIQSDLGATAIAEAIYDMQPDYPQKTGEQPKNSWAYKTLYLTTGPDPDGLGGQLRVGFQNTSTRAPANQFWFAQIDLDAITIEGIQPVAINPRPANDDLVLTTTPTLQWDAAIDTAKHDVYLGVSFADVNTATVADAAIYQGRQDVKSFTTSPLVPGKTYYWRIDEVSGTAVFRGEVWRFTVLGDAATDPIPSDGAMYVDPNPVLAWSPGVMAQSHDVYLGTSRSAVTNATTASPEFQGNRTEPNHVPPTLAYDTIYYWRIDERNADATVTQGSVWSFQTVPFVPVTDPSLAGWWKLDDGQGKIMFDWSTRGNHGAYLGDPNWIVGTLDGALAFTGYEYVECGSAASLNITAAITVATWVRTNDAGNSENNPYVAKGNTSYALRQNTGNAIEFSIYDGTAQQAVASPVDGSFNGVWHHLAGTYDGSNLNLYVDGQPQATAPYTGSIATNTFGVNFARDAEQTWCWYNGALDDVRIYNRALTQAEIQQIMRGDPLLAWNPSPANRAITDVQKALPLSWSAGDGAAQHDVYLGTDAAAVGLATTSDTTGIYRGRQTATTYTPSAALEWGPTYAWRIDEVQGNGTVSKGRTWTFTVADYLIVDDFESYNDLCNRIFFTWLGGAPDSGSLDTDCPRPPYAGNGTGSAVGNYDPPFAEPTIIHSGQQSMPVFYDNTAGASVSEAVRTFDVPQDWTFGQVKTLVLYFRGDAANGAGQLHVKINGTQVAYTGSAEALARPLWRQWNIDLASLTGLKAVQTLTLGVSGAVKGTLYFDDIRLYRVAPPVPVSVDPGTAGLAGYYTFEGDVKDSSGRNNNGVTVNDPTYGSSLSGMGQAIQLDGVNDYVELPIGGLVSTLTSATVAAWVNSDTTIAADWQRVFDFGNGVSTGYMFLTASAGTDGIVRFAISKTGGGDAESRVTSPASDVTGWHHMAVVIDGTAGTLQLYLDGEVMATNTTATLPVDLGNTTQNWLGRSQYEADSYYTGALDEFRIYNRALTAGEVRYLAGGR